MVVNSAKSLLNLGLKYYCFKSGGVISQWVALKLVRRRKKMVIDNRRVLLLVRNLEVDVKEHLGM